MKSFETLVLASITSGTDLSAAYPSLHEAVEHVLGHLIWRHEYAASRKVAADLILARYPDLPTDPIAEVCAAQAALLERLGPELTMPMGNTVRSASPLETLRDIYITKGVRLTSRADEITR